MKYLSLLLLAGFSAAGLSAAAQSTPSDPELNADLRGDYENAVLRDRLNSLSSARIAGPNDVMITQVGADHQVFVQTQALTGNRPTEVDVIQRGGNGNQASLQLTGDGSNVALTQNGTSNRYTGVLRADDADIMVLQDGNFNVISQQGTVKDGSQLELTQRGDNNVLNADYFSTQIKVTQTGGANATLTEIVPGNPR